MDGVTLTPCRYRIDQTMFKYVWYVDLFGNQWAVSCGGFFLTQGGELKRYYNHPQSAAESRTATFDTIEQALEFWKLHAGKVV